MALVQKTQGIPQNKKQDTKLAMDELEYLLNKIREMQFQGDELDVLFKTVMKLQNQYLELKDN